MKEFDKKLKIVEKSFVNIEERKKEKEEKINSTIEKLQNYEMKVMSTQKEIREL